MYVSILHIESIKRFHSPSNHHLNVILVKMLIVPREKPRTKAKKKTFLLIFRQIADELRLTKDEDEEEIFVTFK